MKFPVAGSQFSVEKQEAPSLAGLSCRSGGIIDGEPLSNGS